MFNQSNFVNNRIQEFWAILLLVGVVALFFVGALFSPFSSSANASDHLKANSAAHASATASTFVTLYKSESALALAPFINEKGHRIQISKDTTVSELSSILNNSELITWKDVNGVTRTHKIKNRIDPKSITSNPDTTTLWDINLW